MAAPAVITAVLSGCVGCQAGVEYLQREIDGAINLITFCTFLLISAWGLVFHSKFFTVRQHIPIRSYLLIVSIFFVVNMCNNYSLKFNVSMPLFIIFKSGSLLANVILGRFWRHHYYSMRQIFAVLVTTVGVIVFTMASAESKRPWASPPPEWSKGLPFAPFWIGVFLMAFALFLSACLGICQEDLFRTYGRHHEEALFYVHFLSIPAFALLGDDIWRAASHASQAPPIQLMGVNVSLWTLVFGVCGLQYLCTSQVFRLASVTSSLNVTMVITLRKFLSLFISIYLFNNHFNTFHAVGTVFVFLGTALFTDALFK